MSSTETCINVMVTKFVKKPTQLLIREVPLESSEEYGDPEHVTDSHPDDDDETAAILVAHVSFYDIKTTCLAADDLRKLQLLETTLVIDDYQLRSEPSDEMFMHSLEVAPQYLNTLTTDNRTTYKLSTTSGVSLDVETLQLLYMLGLTDVVIMKGK